MIFFYDFYVLMDIYYYNEEGGKNMNWKNLYYVSSNGYIIYASNFGSYDAFVEECRTYEEGLK